MDFLKKCFPVSFMPTFTKSGGWFAFGIILHIVGGMILDSLIALLIVVQAAILSPLSFITFGLTGILSIILDVVLGLTAFGVWLYSIAGLVILILVFAKVIKVDSVEEVSTEAVETPVAEAEVAETPAVEVEAAETPTEETKDAE